ncbi:TonB family protein [Propionivibrio sp.]|uniref:TonB family protein n=1 Tax=Propionivibrio sp. TaxID=2212460 RepID=UPI003BF31F96
MPPSSRRTLLQALTFSLLIHGALLLSIERMYPLRLDLPATTINVVVSRDRRGEPAKPATKPLAEPVKPSVPVVRKAVTPRIAVPAPSPVSAFSEPPDQQAVRDAAPPSSSAGLAAKAGAGSEPAREGVSADDMRQYRLSLATAARRFKRYPALARERGWEGTVEVALNINARSPLPEVLLVRSSGRGVLDEQALETIAQAARVTTLPEGLKGRDMRVPLSIKFSLDESQ